MTNRAMAGFCRPLLYAPMVLAAMACAAQAGSIFDDDYTPPAGSVPAPVVSKTPNDTPPTLPDDAPVKPPAPVSSNDKVTPSSELPPVVRPPAAPLAERRQAIPPKPAQANSRQLLKQVFAKELADRSFPAREKFAKKLMDQAAESAAVPVDQYVMLMGAYESALEAGDLRLSFRVADSLSKDFALEPSGLKEHAVLKLPLKAYAVKRAENVNAGIEVFDALAAADEYPEAARVGALLEQAAAGDAPLRAVVQKRVKAIEETRIARDRYSRQLEKLKTLPDDPAANLAVGQYLCFTKGQWEQGLPMLAHGTDAAMKAAAEKELAVRAAGVTANIKPADATALADAWWTASEREPSATLKGKVQGRAVYWYRQGLPGLGGLAKMRVEKRIAEVPAELVPSNVRILNTTGATEAERIIADVTARDPEVFKDVQALELVKYHNGLEVKGGHPKSVAGAFSGATPSVAGGGGITFCCLYEDFPAGQYVIVYRVQELSDVKGDNVCFLDVCRNGNTISGSHPKASDFNHGQWSVMPLPLQLKDATKIEYRLWAGGHEIALDRIYVFRVQ